MVLTKGLTSAMAAQLDRVNETDSPVVRRLRTQLQERDNLIADLRAQLRTLQSATVSPSPFMERGQGGEVNTPVLTQSAFAKLWSVSQATISRTLSGSNTHRIEGHVYKLDGRWVIAADAKFIRGPRRKPRRKHNSPSLRSGEGARGWG